MDKEFPCTVDVVPGVDQAALAAVGAAAPVIQYARAPAASGPLPTARLPANQGSAR